MRKVIGIFIVEFFVGAIILPSMTADINSANQDIVDISGVWSGNWYGSGVSGTSEYHLIQTASSITGYELETYYSDCSAKYSVSGSVDFYGNVVLDKSLTTSSGHCNWCSQVTWTGVLSESNTKLTGSYSGGTCYGMFSLTKIDEADDEEPDQYRNIMLTGFWYPTGDMIAQFSTNSSLNPGGWEGANWENLGYNIYSYFPNSKDGYKTGDFQVDYQSTLNDFQRITDEIKPVAIISFGSNLDVSYPYDWEIENNSYNLGCDGWKLDNEVVSPPYPCPPDETLSEGYVRNSTLPVSVIVDAVKNEVHIDVGIDNDPGNFLCGYMAYLGMRYQSIHSSSNDPYQCLAAGFIHVKSDLNLEDAMRATNVTIREVINSLKNGDDNNFNSGNGIPGFELILIFCALAFLYLIRCKRQKSE